MNIGLIYLLDVKEMNPNLRTFLNICQGLSKGVAFKFLGEDAYGDEYTIIIIFLTVNRKFGVAVSYLNAASSFLQGLETPQVGSALAKYRNEVEESKDDIEHLKRKYEFLYSRYSLSDTTMKTITSISKSK